VTTTALISPSTVSSTRVQQPANPITTVVQQVMSVAAGLAAMVGLSPT
jgi:hypothetical protein